MTAPAETQFVVYERGRIRDMILQAFREGLRDRVDPETGQPFTEDIIRLTTQPSSRFYMEADAIDLMGLGIQQRAITMANNIRVDGSNSQWLQSYHGHQWGETLLPAVGGSGTAVAPATPGAIFPGSTIIPDPNAAQATDANGQRFQVFVTSVTNGSGQAALILAGIDTGETTNIKDASTLKWSQNAPVSAAPEFQTTSDFTGGVDAETDQQFMARLLARIRNKPGAGNQSQIRSWARAATFSVEDAFVYACAKNAGSTVLTVTQKRANVSGPLARIPNLATLQAVTDYLVPPGSSVNPVRSFFEVVAPVPLWSDMVTVLQMRRASTSGWADAKPWPKLNEAGLNAPAVVSSVVSSLIFRVTTDSGSLPGGATLLENDQAPSIMVWRQDDSRFEVLQTIKVEDLGGDLFEITLDATPVEPIVDGEYISPEAELNEDIATAVEGYYDTLGPGEVVPVDGSDIRGARAFRFPEQTEGYPQKAGQTVVTALVDALGGAATAADLKFVTPTSNPVPADVSDGPNLFVVQRFAVYDLEE